MARVFTAEFNGGFCPVCKQDIRKGQQICYKDGRPRHAQQSCDEMPDENEERELTVQWATDMTEESAERQALLELEASQLAPLQRPVCPVCYLELPKSMVCGVC